MNKKNNLKIYTYLNEEKEKFAYIQICLKTWKKSLGEECEIMVINKENLQDFFPNKILPGQLMATCSFPVFFNFLASAVLFEHGGLFLSPETIMTPAFKLFYPVLKSVEIMGYKDGFNNRLCSGYLYAKKGSEALKSYINKVIDSDFNISENFFSELLFNDFYNALLGINAEAAGYLMEQKMFGVCNKFIYNRYYFTDICDENEFLASSKGMTALNDNWTPEEFKSLDEYGCLQSGVLLSKIFRKILFDD